MPSNPTANGSPLVSLSIVSHGQCRLLAPFLGDLFATAGSHVELILTLNIPEDEAVLAPFLRAAPWPVHIIRNLRARGFGANHNHAFEAARGEYFVVLNPDLRADALRFEPLIQALSGSFAGTGRPVGCVGPRIVDAALLPSDSPRRYPTLLRMAQRLLLRRRGVEYPELTARTPVDWVGGMFMMFTRSVYRQIGGFDERFFMYMEDVDICRRLFQHGYEVVFVPEVEVIHDARRQNRRSIKHLRWHLRSLARYMFLYPVTRRWH